MPKKHPYVDLISIKFSNKKKSFVDDKIFLVADRSRELDKATVCWGRHRHVMNRELHNLLSVLSMLLTLVLFKTAVYFESFAVNQTTNDLS